MARRLRLLYEGAIYHVTFRGVRRESIFRDDKDRIRFLESLAERVETYRIRLYLYCLMSNHVHLVVETPQANLPAFMGSLLTSYPSYFNRRHRRSGHLTQGRYHSPLVEGDDYLMRLSRYVHLNPVRVRGLRTAPPAERRKALRQYQWSSYRGYAGLRKPEAFVDHGPMWGLVKPFGRGKLPQRYRRYVEEGLRDTDEELEAQLKKPGIGIGSAEFIERLEGLYLDRLEEAVAEDVAFRRPASRFAAEEGIAEACTYYGMPAEELSTQRKQDQIKPVLAWLLTNGAGLSQREAAGYLGVNTGAAVSQQLKGLNRSQTTEQKKAIRHFRSIFNF